MTEPGTSRSWLSRLGFALLTVFLIGRVWFFEVVEVANDSMSPTLMAGELVWVWRGPPAHVQPGSVVLYDISDVRSIKRVVAEEGQIVELSAGALFVDGQGVRKGSELVAVERDCRVSEVRGEREQWGELGAVILPGGDAPSETIPENHVYILGDHRAASSDSRQWGPVPSAAVEGVVWRVVWSRDPCGTVRRFRLGARVR